MVRYVATSAELPAWVEVSSAAPCRICGATSGCGVHEDGEFGCCLEVVSDRPIATGGWLHRIGGRRGMIVPATCSQIAVVGTLVSPVRTLRDQPTAPIVHA
jgi:hypothetical protein